MTHQKTRTFYPPMSGFRTEHHCSCGEVVPATDWTAHVGPEAADMPRADGLGAIEQFPEIHVSDDLMTRLARYRRETWFENYPHATGWSKPLPADLAAPFANLIPCRQLAEAVSPDGRRMLYVEKSSRDEIRCCG